MRDLHERHPDDLAPLHDPETAALLLVASFLLGALIAGLLWLIASNADAILDWIAPERHTTLEQAIERIEARHNPAHGVWAEAWR